MPRKTFAGLDVWLEWQHLDLRYMLPSAVIVLVSRRLTGIVPSILLTGSLRGLWLSEEARRRVLEFACACPCRSDVCSIVAVASAAIPVPAVSVSVSIV